MVMGVITLMMALLAPALTSMKGAQDVTRTAYDIAGILDQARAYAMSNNTHVFVGFKEVNASNNSTASSQLAGTGRVVVAVVASKDGTNGYGSNPSSWQPSTGNLATIGRLQYFDNMHLADFSSATFNNNMSKRPAVQTGYEVGNTVAFTSATPFFWPPGASSGNAQYTFNAVIEFDSQGVAWFQQNNATTLAGMVPFFEIGLQPAHGNVVMPANTPDVAAIQIDGMTGSTHIYRP